MAKYLEGTHSIQPGAVDLKEPKLSSTGKTYVLGSKVDQVVLPGGTIARVQTIVTTANTAE